MEQAKVHQWPLAELSYPQLAPEEMGGGGRSPHKNCSNTGKRMEESEKPQAGGNRNREEGWKQREWDTGSRSD